MKQQGILTMTIDVKFEYDEGHFAFADADPKEREQLAREIAEAIISESIKAHVHTIEDGVKIKSVWSVENDGWLVSPIED